MKVKRDDAVLTDSGVGGWLASRVDELGDFMYGVGVDLEFNERSMSWPRAQWKVRCVAPQESEVTVELHIPWGALFTIPNATVGGALDACAAELVAKLQEAR